MYRVLFIGVLLAWVTACGGGESGTVVGVEPDTGAKPPRPVNKLVICEGLDSTDALAAGIAIRYPAVWLVMGSSSAAGAGASRYRHSWAGKLTADVTEHGAD